MPSCVRDDRTCKLAKAAKQSLFAMRSSAQDPAQSNEARRKRIEKALEMSLAERALEREHGPVADPAVYEREILPKIRAMSVRRLVSLTGLSEHYLWKIRKSEGRLHPRFWESIKVSTAKNSSCSPARPGMATRAEPRAVVAEANL